MSLNVPGGGVQKNGSTRKEPSSGAVSSASETACGTPKPWRAECTDVYAHKPRVYGADGTLVAEVGNAEDPLYHQDRWNADARDLVAAVNILESDWLVRLSASEYACYRWPEDTAEHRAMRAAFMDGASHSAAVAETNAAAPGDTGPTSSTECCIPRAGEPSFVLLGRDPQAPELVDQWARDRMRLEPDSDKPSKAFKIAREMRSFKQQNPEIGMPSPSSTSATATETDGGEG